MFFAWAEGGWKLVTGYFIAFPLIMIISYFVLFAPLLGK